MAEGYSNSDGVDSGLDRQSAPGQVSPSASAEGTTETKADGVFADEYDPEQVVDLRQKGLITGDVIDPYLDKFLANDVEVRIPEGEYDWHGSGFGATPLRNAGVVGEGEVILHAVDGDFSTRIHAESGTVVFENLTVRGEMTDTHIDLAAGDEGHVRIDNWNFPDGSDADGQFQPFRISEANSGVVEISDSYVEGFFENGLVPRSDGDGNGRHPQLAVGETPASNLETSAAADTTSGDESTAELSNRFLIDGTTGPTVTSYKLSVSGHIEIDPALSSTVEDGTPWDDMGDSVETDTVVSVVGKGIDGYRYSGDITSLTVDGTVEMAIGSVNQ